MSDSVDPNPAPNYIAMFDSVDPNPREKRKQRAGAVCPLNKERNSSLKQIVKSSS